MDWKSIKPADWKTFKDDSCGESGIVSPDSTSYLVYMEGVKGEPFAACKDGCLEQTFTTLEEAMGFLGL